MKFTLVSILIAGVFIGGAVLLSRGNGGVQTDTSVPINNVSMVDGKQIIEIRAKGGYQPAKSVARSGVPTILRFNTSGTFDCSSSVRISSLGVSKLLPQTGTTDIDLGVPKAGVLQGTCGMGMYPFEVAFQS